MNRNALMVRAALLLGLVFSLCRLPASSAEEDTRGPNSNGIETLMDLTGFSQLSLNRVSDFTPVPWGGWVFAAGKELIWSVGWDSLLDPKIPAASRPEIREVLFLAGGGLIAVSGDRLMYWKEGGFHLSGDSLPNASMSIAANPQEDSSIFVYGGEGKGSNSVFIFSQGELTKMLEAPRTITAFAAEERSLYYAIEDVLYRQAVGGAPTIMLKLDSKKSGSIQSLAVDPKREVVYLSTPRLTICLSLVKPVSEGMRLVKDYGGIVRVKDGQLFLLDSKTNKILSFSTFLVPS